MDQKVVEAGGLVLAGALVLVALTGLIAFFEPIRQMQQEGSYTLMTAFALPVLLIMLGVLKLIAYFSKNKEKDCVTYRAGGALILAYWVIRIIANGFEPSITLGWVFIVGIVLVWDSFR